MTRRHFTIIIAALLLAALLATAIGAAADGPVIWKQHCPRWYEVQTVVDKDLGGVHVLCIHMADAEGVR